MLRFILVTVFLSLSILKFSESAEEIWEEDISKQIEIGASTDGYDHVGLKCSPEKMTVELRTTDDFSGVIYTQGSFYSRKSPCFLDPSRGKSFTLDIPLDQCGTEKEGHKYTNILVVQHDDELVTPGDAAFDLECDFSKPRVLTVSADLNGNYRRRARSSIALLDADPARDRRKRAAFVKSETEEVTFEPKKLSKISDEL